MDSAFTGMIYGVKIGISFESYDGELEDYQEEDRDDEGNSDAEESIHSKEDKNKKSYFEIKEFAESLGLEFEVDGSSSSSNYVDAVYVGIKFANGTNPEDMVEAKKRFHDIYNYTIQHLLTGMVSDQVEISEPGLFATYDVSCSS